MRQLWTSAIVTCQTAKLSRTIPDVDLSLRIRDLRKARGLTLVELSDLIGVTPSHLSQIERGKRNVNNHVLTRLASALHVQPYELIAPSDGNFKRLADTISQLSESDRMRVEAFALALLASHEEP